MVLGAPRRRTKKSGWHHHYILKKTLTLQQRHIETMYTLVHASTSYQGTQRLTTVQ